MTVEKDFTESSGNVFADLGLQQPEELQAKVQIAYLISQIINHRHMTQKEAATELDLTQPKISNIMAGRLDGFSLEKLMMLMVKLNRDVEIVIKKKPRTREHAHLNVVYA
ncbi:MAG: XRE family transcriptional regulator [Desulfuromonadales bacterium]|jgi:predicted XRE-type DNA-binding protein|nr:XRE family transcriptional regulator [Desulfuromonadales bacterium]